MMIRVIRNGWFMPAVLFLFSLPVLCQDAAFASAFTFVGNFENVQLPNNPYKLLTGCFIEKTLNSTIIYGYTKIDDDWTINTLDPKNNSTVASSINFETLKGKITPQVYDDLQYYGISEIAGANNFMTISTGNTLLIFRNNGPTYTFQKEITVNDSIAFNTVFPITDSTLILLDYKAKFTESNDIKAYRLNIHTNSMELIFREKMSSNVACYDRTNTRYYDSNKSYFLITDNLDYKISLFDCGANKLSGYTKKLNIPDKSRRALNPKVLKTDTHDSIMKELNLTPRIVNTQFLNDSEIVVNYAIRKTIEKDGLKIKSSVVDILVIRNNTLVFKRTLDDTFVYQKSDFEATGKQNQKTCNPYLRGALPSFLFVGNQLIRFDMEAAIPGSNMSYHKYIQKAKGSVLNLKSKLIHSDYEYLH